MTHSARIPAQAPLKAGLFKRGTLGYLVVLVLALMLFLMVIVPLLMIVFASFTNVIPFSGASSFIVTLDNYINLFRSDLGEVISNTLIVSLGGMVMAVSIGSLLAWLGARTDIPLKPLVHIAGIMPLFVSLVVASVTWSFLGAGRSGYLNIIFDSLGIPLQIELRSLAGITFIHGLYFVPYSYIFVYSALTLVNPDLEQAASVHGASLRQVVNRITFPLVRPALLSAALLSFVSMAEEFPVPAILGAPVGIETLSIRIFNLMTRVPGEPNQAAAASVLLTAIVCFLVYTQRRVLRGRDYRTVTGKGMPNRPIRLRGLKPFAVIFVLLYSFVSLGLPVIALILGATRSNLYVADAAALFDVSQLTTKFIIATLNDPTVQRGLLNSLVTGLATAIFGTAFYFVIVYVVNRTHLPGRQILDYMAMMPLGLPALVMGLGVLWTWLALPVPIYGTLIILVVAFITRYIPQGVRAITSSIAQIHNDLEEAAMISGASRAQAVAKITLPLMRGAVISACFLILVLAMRELTSSLLLYTTNTRVLSIVIYEAYEQGLWTTVASISLIYTALLVVVTIAGRRWMRTEF